MSTPDVIHSSEDLAREACHYAREHILKGCTQLENNVLDEIQRKSLYNAVMKLRALVSETSNLSLELDDAIQRFYARVEL